jgi:hypothetical protein
MEHHLGEKIHRVVVGETQKAARHVLDWIRGTVSGNSREEQRQTEQRARARAGTRVSGKSREEQRRAET